MKRFLALAAASSLVTSFVFASSQPVRGRNGMVASQKMLASEAGLEMLKAGGNAVDAAVATAFALAVTLPRAGNIGGGGFLLFRSAAGEAVAYDFRETAPAAATSEMFLRDGVYDPELHHRSGRAVGVPGTVAGLYLAWQEHGKLPWKQLVGPAIRLARDGILVTDDMERSLLEMRANRWGEHAGTLAQFTRNGEPYRIGDRLKQEDLGRTLERIAAAGPKGFYEGDTARLIVEEMGRIHGLITLDDLKDYRAKKREPVRGTYRGYEIVSMPPPSSGGIALIEMLNILEGYDLSAYGFHSSKGLHLMVESMRRAFADRARDLGDPDFNPGLPTEKLLSKEYAAQLRSTIDPERASTSSVGALEAPSESPDTTHFSVVDGETNAVSITYTIELPFTIVTGGGFLLNTELGDFNAAPGLTTAEGLIGTKANLAAPGKRPLSSMSPTIVSRDGELTMVTGSPGGRTIINTVLQTIVNAVDYGMNAQEIVDAGRIHHQWLPDRIQYEALRFSPDTLAGLMARGHALAPLPDIGCAQVILYRRDEKIFEGGSDGRRRDGGVAAY
jgi:gamma-glutamyltranspeptidase / glutathione hydrolase